MNKELENLKTEVTRLQNDMNVVGIQLKDPAAFIADMKAGLALEMIKELMELDDDDMELRFQRRLVKELERVKAEAAGGRLLRPVE
jgi:hypothetical protein